MQLLSIQYLRALAAIVVVAYHVGFKFGADWTIGQAGVHIFFVISGFLMWLVTFDREVSPARFITQRIVRIVPLYWLLTLLVAAAAIARPNLFHEQPTASHVLQSLLFVPHVSPSGDTFPLLIQGWTLEYEMFFYALFALTLFLPRRFLLLGFSLAIGGLVLMRFVLDPANAVARVYTSPLLLEFLAGVWLGSAFSAGRVMGKRLALFLLAAGVAGLVGSIWILDLPLDRTLIWGIPSLVIVASAIALETHKLMPRLPLLKLLGDASYSIYLSHTVAIVIGSFALHELGLGNPGTPAAVQAGLLVGPATSPAVAAGYYVFMLVFCVATGVLCHRLLERPATSFVRGLLSAPRGKEKAYQAG
jgi:exopolysaccharide production protein ExoZ